MLKNRRMKKSLKLKENLKDFAKSYHGKLLSVIIKEKIERDQFSIKEEFNIWNFNAQRLLIMELEVVYCFKLRKKRNFLKMALKSKYLKKIFLK